MCNFPVDPGFHSSIEIPGCHGFQKCVGSVFFFFHCKFDVLVKVKVGVELCKMFTSNADMAQTD